MSTRRDIPMVREWLDEQVERHVPSRPSWVPPDWMSSGVDPVLSSDTSLVRFHPAFDPGELYDPRFTFNPSDETSFVEGRRMVLPEIGKACVRGGEISALWGAAVEWVDRIRVNGFLPGVPLDWSHRPRLKTRMACLQLMKSGVYRCHVTPEEFPSFFDQKHMSSYFRFLAENRFNALALWNFHPFPYFCEIAGFPEAHELSADRIHANKKHLHWLCQAAEQYGIRLYFHFYNIQVPDAFAKAHNLPGTSNCFQGKDADLVAAYQREALICFCSEFPKVGLMACVGEGVPGGHAEKYTRNVIIAALKQVKPSPPLVLRQWSTLTPEGVSEHVLGEYEPLIIMHKHNGEHIAGPAPDSRLPDWIDLGVPVVINFHMLSEVGPFRWAPFRYIREMLLNYQALGAQGFHVFPHWPWRAPFSGETYAPLGMDRDWCYHAAWGRYGFDPVRDPDEETRYWIHRISAREKIPAERATRILEGYERTGPVLPRLQQHLWIHYDNHSVLSAGFTLGQMTLARSMHGRKLVETNRLSDVQPLRFELRGSAQMGTFTFDQCTTQCLRELRKARRLGPARSGSVTQHEMDLARDIRGMTYVTLYLRHKARVQDRVLKSLATGDEQQLSRALHRLERLHQLFQRYAAEMGEAYSGIGDVGPYFPFYAYKGYEMPYHWTDALSVYDRELKNLRTVYELVRDPDKEFSVCWYASGYREPEVHEWAARQTEKGTWLEGTPDFIPWPWNFQRMRRVVLLMDHAAFEEGLSVFADGEALRDWIEHGGWVDIHTRPFVTWSHRPVFKALFDCADGDLDFGVVHQGEQAFLGWRYPGYDADDSAVIEDGWGRSAVIHRGRGGIKIISGA